MSLLNYFNFKGIYRKIDSIRTMKQALITVLLLLPFLLNSKSFAQKPPLKQPQFQLTLSNDYIAEGQDHFLTASFGYDTAATVGIDLLFGENAYPPIGGFGGERTMTFLLPDSSTASQSDNSPIDIMPRPKPTPGTVDSFTIQYQFWFSSISYPTTITWDRTFIPSQIKGIIVTSPGDPGVELADLTKQDSVVIGIDPSAPNYYYNWLPAIITIYYNTTPPQFLDVRANDGPAALLSGLGAYPNPMAENGRLAFTLGEPANVHVIAYDAAGRLVLNREMNSQAGMNQVDLNNVGPSHGAILLHVDATSGSRHESKDVMVLKD
jgi:hypothetical protein